MAFFRNVCRVFSEQWVNFLRLALILCLCNMLFLGFTLPQVSFIPDSERIPASEETGVGGGIYFEEIPEGLLAGSLESAIMEPVLFFRPQTLLYNTYTVVRGDMIGELAVNFGLNQDTLISVNNIRNTRLIQIGQVLRIPNQDGIMYTVNRGDTLETIAQRHNTDVPSIRIANELFSDAVPQGTALFIPGGRLGWIERQEINGELFIWPTSGRVTSPFGYRRSPFGGNRQFHSGIDIGAPIGTPVRAAMSGRVSVVGWDNVMGNYIVISHHSGYRTMYGHLSRTRVRTGAYVGTGERIGDVGSTGLSTGPHLHFSIFKNGVAVNPRNLLR